MSTSERATARISELPQQDRPLSEQFRLVAIKYTDADAAANLLEELKSATLAQFVGVRVERDPSLSESRAERQSKASQEWDAYVRHMCQRRADANKLRLQLEYIRMRFNEWQSREANSRHEARLSR
jgi:hypothetical protein